MSHHRVARRERAGSGLAAAGTTVVHAAAFFFFAGGLGQPEPGPQVYAVQLVAAPKPPEVKRPEAVQRQADPPPPPPEPVTRKPPPEDAAPVPPPPPVVEKEPLPEAATAVELAPEVEPSTGNDVATVDSPGIDFQFPGYLRNIVSQVYQRWQRPKNNTPLRAEVQFLIRRDGSIGANSIRFTERSGSFEFDLNAQGAIEAAGAANAFGPLPEGYPNDVLPVVFFFDPSGVRVGNQ